MQLPTLGNPQPQPDAQAPGNLGEMQAQLVAAQRQQQFAELLMQQGYVKNSGALGAFAQAFSAWRGKKLDKKAGESVAEAMKRKFDEENRREQEQAMARAREDQRIYERDRGDKVEDRNFAVENRAGPSSLQEFQASQSNPAYASFLQQQNQSKAQPPAGTNQANIIASRREALETQILPGLAQELGPAFTPQMKQQVITDYLGSGRFTIKDPKATATGKPMPVGALKEDLAVEDALGAADGAFTIAAKHLGRLGKREVDPSLAGRAGAATRNVLNMGNEQSANLVEMQADKTHLVNESLRLNKGVQTEGDSQRATKELMEATDYVTTIRAFQRLVELNKRAVTLQQHKREMIRRNYGQGGGQSPQAAQPPAPAGDGWGDIQEVP